MRLKIVDFELKPERRIQDAGKALALQAERDKVLPVLRQISSAPIFRWDLQWEVKLMSASGDEPLGKTMPEVSLDVSVTRCPKCGKFYVDASWYFAEIGSDIECSICGHAFNSKKHLADRVLVQFNVGESGKVKAVNLSKRLPSQ